MYSGWKINPYPPQILHRRRQGRLRHLTWVWSSRWMNLTITKTNFQVSTPLSKKVLIFLPNLKIFDFLLRHCWDSKICVNLPSDVCRNISKAQISISTNIEVLTSRVAYFSRFFGIFIIFSLNWHYSGSQNFYVRRDSTYLFGYVPTYIWRHVDTNFGKILQLLKNGTFLKKSELFLLREAETWKLACRRFLGPSKRSYPSERSWPSQSP